MTTEQPFFMRAPWKYDRGFKRPPRQCGAWGLETRSLHAGFRPLGETERCNASRTICMHPRTITHEHMTQAERDAAGIDDGLIRLSVGLENAQDIIADLDQALAAL